MAQRLPTRAFWAQLHSSFASMEKQVTKAEKKQFAALQAELEAQKKLCNGCWYCMEAAKFNPSPKKVEIADD